MKFGVPFKVIGLLCINLDREEVSIDFTLSDKNTGDPKFFVFRSREEKEKWKRDLEKAILKIKKFNILREVRGVNISYLGGEKDLI